MFFIDFHTVASILTKFFIVVQGPPKRCFLLSDPEQFILEQKKKKDCIFIHPCVTDLEIFDLNFSKNI
jgi:hypothetical protein